MKRELVEPFYDRWPEWLSWDPRPTQHYQISNLMAFGFECGDGWRDLLWELFEKIELALRGRRGGFTVTQVKEKYATLRVYWHDEFDDSGQPGSVSRAVEEAEARSAVTCEQCGAPGKERGKHWWYTACDAHTKPGDM